MFQLSVGRVRVSELANVCVLLRIHCRSLLSAATAAAAAVVYTVNSFVNTASALL